MCDFVVPKGNFVNGGPKQLPEKKFLDTLVEGRRGWIGIRGWMDGWMDEWMDG